jgi:glycosyltransferase involved in cell wall biosynthesis
MSASPAVTFITYNAVGLAESGVETHLVVLNRSAEPTEQLLHQQFALGLPERLVIHRITAERHWGFYRQAIAYISNLDSKPTTIITRALSFLPHLLWLRARRPGLRVVFETHDYYWRPGLRDDLSLRKIWKKSLYERLFFPHLDGMVCLMESQRELYRTHLPKVPIAVIRTGLNAIHKPILPKPQVLAYVGSLDPHKGVDRVLASARYFGPDARFVIIGGKTEMEKQVLATKARECGLEGRFRITGWIDKIRMARELAEVKWGLVPLRDDFFNAHLTSPLKLFDFAAFGIPVLASDLPTLRELVIPGKTGFLVDWNDPQSIASAMATSDADYSQMVGSVVSRAEDWLWAERGRRLTAFCKELHGASSAFPDSTPRPAGLEVRRHAANPIIHSAMLPGNDGDNINGPSLIRVPSWVTDPPARYLLYFAHHNGAYIRMAHADDPGGPWRIHAGGALDLKQAPGVHGHIASPDVVVDEERRQLRLYFHGNPPAGGKQVSFVAISPDGVHWTASPVALGPFYFRVFRWRGGWFAFAKGGDLYRSDDGLTPFVLLGNPFNPTARNRPDFNDVGDIRHLAVDLNDDVLWAYYTRIGDKPERILRQRIALTPDPSGWRAEAVQEVLRPELSWEGADLPITASRSGASHGRTHAVRDPAVLRDDGRLLLIYSIAGESGLALAEISEGKPGAG